MEKKITVTAHAGSMSTPDNSEESLFAALESGADIIELDVNFTEDMTPVLSHDDPNGRECVTLARAFEIIAPHESVSMNLDMKHTYNLSAVESEIEKFSLKGRAFFTGIREENVEAVKKQCSFTPYYLNFEFGEKPSAEEIHAAAEKIISLGAVGLNTNFGNLTKEIIEIMQSHSLLVSAWTVNEEADMDKVISMGADNITTRKPDILIKKL